MRREAPSTSDEIIDSRDIIARLEELTEERDDLERDIDDMQEAVDEAGEDDKDAAQDDLDAAQDRLKEWDEDNGDELKALQQLNDDAEGYADDWKHGAALIREDYFVEYAQQLADDIGAIDRDAKWPCTHIDWEAAAEELKADYTEVNFDGTTYLVR